MLFLFVILYYVMFLNAVAIYWEERLGWDAIPTSMLSLGGILLVLVDAFVFRKIANMWLEWLDYSERLAYKLAR